ncbi:MAG TPA: SSI family serine proteinase inhibitor [Gaiellaceae bacterium]|nr:SSI family serine proteinase inhibitor [Gaiellaceae bacterium]
MNAAAALVLAVAALAGGGHSTQLRIALYPAGVGGDVETYTLRCAPAGGTVPAPGRACRTLAGLPHAFAPVPRNRVCTQIAGGPQEAIVTGTLDGRRVWARLRLRNGCEIDRWRRLATVVPGFGGATR